MATARESTLLGVAQLARYLGVSVRQIQRWSAMGTMPGPTVAKPRRYWSRVIIDRWLEENRLSRKGEGK
jgi:DNA-binding transcriptional MerR regulator